jgi:hypothetical protein
MISSAIEFFTWTTNKKEQADSVAGKKYRVHGYPDVLSRARRNHALSLERSPFFEGG